MCDEILYNMNEACRPQICSNCVGKISLVEPPYCMKCSKPLEDDMRELCTDCEKKAHVYVRGVSAFSYSKAMKASMYGFKYNNKREYAGFYASKIAESYSDVIRTWNVDVLIPVPLHAAKKRKRGYNQATVLAKELERLLDIKVDDNILKRVKNTRPQKELTDKERYNNIKNAFQISTNELKYNKVILVDDIYTTGVTIDECAKVLMDAGVGKVYFITACIGNGF